MPLAQLICRECLGDIQVRLMANQGKLVHMGLKGIGDFLGHQAIF